MIDVQPLGYIGRHRKLSKLSVVGRDARLYLNQFDVVREDSDDIVGAVGACCASSVYRALFQ